MTFNNKSLVAKLSEGRGNSELLEGKDTQGLRSQHREMQWAQNRAQFMRSQGGQRGPPGSGFSRPQRKMEATWLLY